MSHMAHVIWLIWVITWLILIRKSSFNTNDRKMKTFVRQFHTIEHWKACKIRQAAVMLNLKCEDIHLLLCSASFLYILEDTSSLFFDFQGCMHSRNQSKSVIKVPGSLDTEGLALPLCWHKNDLIESIGKIDYICTCWCSWKSSCSSKHLILGCSVHWPIFKLLINATQVPS